MNNNPGEDVIIMSEENREAIERVRAHGELLKRGAPHQQPIGEDILWALQALQDERDIRSALMHDYQAEIDRLVAERDGVKATMDVYIGELDRQTGELGDALIDRDIARAKVDVAIAKRAPKTRK